MTESPGLLPCPFCGGEAELRQNQMTGEMTMAHCRHCGASAFHIKWNWRAAAKVRAIREGDGEVVAYRGRYEHPGEEPDAWHLFHGKPVNGHPDWRSEPLYAASPIPATGGEKECDPDGCKAHIDAFMGRAIDAETENARLREAIAEIADFDPEGPFDPDTLRLIRIAGAARRAVPSQEAPK